MSTASTAFPIYPDHSDLLSPDTDPPTRDLLALVGILNVASDLAFAITADFATGHAVGCGCGFCDSAGARRTVEQDLNGLRWHLSIVTGLIANSIYGTVRVDELSTGDALRVLAAALDMNERAEADPCHVRTAGA